MARSLLTTPTMTTEINPFPLLRKLAIFGQNRKKKEKWKMRSLEERTDKMCYVLSRGTWWKWLNMQLQPTHKLIWLWYCVSAYCVSVTKLRAHNYSCYKITMLFPIMSGHRDCDHSYSIVLNRSMFHHAFYAWWNKSTIDQPQLKQNLP